MLKEILEKIHLKEFYYGINIMKTINFCLNEIDKRDIKKQLEKLYGNENTKISIFKDKFVYKLYYRSISIDCDTYPLGETAMVIKFDMPILMKGNQVVADNAKTINRILGNYQKISYAINNFIKNAKFNDDKFIFPKNGAIIL